MNIEQSVSTIKKPENLEGEMVDSSSTTPAESMAVDDVNIRKMVQEKDEKELAETRETLGISNVEIVEERKGWQVVRKPRGEFRQDIKLVSDSLFDRFSAWSKSFSKAEREKRKGSKEAERQFGVDHKKYSEADFNYSTGAGVEGRVGSEVGILANGFYECSGLVFQTEKGVSIIHISPNAIKAQWGDSDGEIVEDHHVNGHIGSALRGLLGDNKGAVKTSGDVKLSPEEVKKLQEMVDNGKLKATMLAGEDLVPNQVASIDLVSSAKWLGLPFIATDVYDVRGLGEGGYSVYANPKEIYFFGENNFVMKKGLNFPPKMFDYKEV